MSRTTKRQCRDRETSSSGVKPHECAIQNAQGGVFGTPCPLKHLPALQEAPVEVHHELGFSDIPPGVV